MLHLPEVIVQLLESFSPDFTAPTWKKAKVLLIGFIFAPAGRTVAMTPSNDHSLFASMEAMKPGAFDDLLVPLEMGILLNRIHAATEQQKEQ